jgi:hypothetical protein
MRCQILGAGLILPELNNLSHFKKECILTSSQIIKGRFVKDEIFSWYLN